MVRITKDLLIRRSEHNDKILSTLQEITLHQFDIEKIELIQNYCKHLRILYLQSNLIGKIENVNKLKQLEYLNLALNNVECIEGLNNCESLSKLDLTVNFVDCDTLQQSIQHLKPCRFLTELHLTGNPCTNFNGYRYFVIHTIPQLKRLDGTDITKSERIKARQQYSTILHNLSIEADRIANKKLEKKRRLAKGGKLETEEYCPELRIEDHRMEEEQKKKDQAEAEAKQKFGKPEDIIKKAHDKMNAMATEGSNGELPKQRNLSRIEWKMDEKGENGTIRVIIEAPRFLDTSEMSVDIHPLWFQTIIKGKSLLLHLPNEVIVSKSDVRRILSTGWLELIMPKLNWQPKQTKNPKRRKPQTKNTKVDTKAVSLNIVETKSNDCMKEMKTKSYCGEDWKEKESNEVVFNMDELDFDPNDVPPLE